MGVCMGKESQMMSGDLDPDGRFISLKEENETTTVLSSTPRTPIIFILGGPGSGKITHCDRAVQERQGIAHINMTDLIQQHIVGNGLGDFGQIPPSNLIEVLQMEMKMAVNSKGFLISGYPRSMRDVVEYTKKLSRIDGVILLNWHTRILEKQIEYGSQLGDTVLQLARMELKNYSKNVLAVAEYFDQLKKLKVVDGERQPTDVYQDFFKAVDQLLNNDNLTNKTITNNDNKKLYNENRNENKNENKNIKIIWIIGGPGSNKSLLSSTAVRLHQDEWEWICVGQELRNLTYEINEDINGDNLNALRNNILKGELANNDIVINIIKQAIKKSNKKLFIIDGFPRNYQQVNEFQKYIPCDPLPPCMLVDCSEVELGRSLGRRAENNLDRLDDQNSSAVKRRLEIYRTITLPTLKILDDQHRLHIIDGDIEDKSGIVDEFNEGILKIVKGLKLNKLPLPSSEKRKPSTDTINKMYNEVDQMGE